MGAVSFERFGFGKTANEAYKEAREEAESYSGHRDGYSGDLNSKSGFTEVTVPKGTNPAKYAEWIETASETLWNDAKKHKKIMRKVPVAHHKNTLVYAKIYDDKWGEALCVKITGKAAANYRTRNGLKGKKGDIYLFFGMAAD